MSSHSHVEYISTDSIVRNYYIIIDYFDYAKTFCQKPKVLVVKHCFTSLFGTKGLFK